jgi:hypothetical protein
MEDDLKNIKSGLVLDHTQIWNLSLGNRTEL